MKKKIVPKKTEKKLPRILKNEPMAPEKKDPIVESPVGNLLEVYQVSTVNNNAAVIANVSDQEIRDFQAVLSYQELLGTRVSSRVSAFYEASDERLTGRPFWPNVLLPHQRLRFRLLQKKNAHGGDCVVQVVGKTIDGKPVSVEERILLIV